jgi:hypothetical protein
VRADPLLAFYLIIDLAVGGTSGWFPDKVGNKPWFDGSESESLPRPSSSSHHVCIAAAMYDFYTAKDAWHATWPTNAADGAFRM